MASYKQPRRPGTRRRTWPVAGALAAAAAIGLAAGCSSDLPNRLGNSLVEPEFSTVLEPLLIDDVTGYSAFDVTDPNLPLTRYQTLYLGTQIVDGDTTASSILVNFDFGQVFSEDFPAEMFTPTNISRVWFSLTKLEFYGEPRDNVAAPQQSYALRRLPAPFDTTITYPGPVPAGAGAILNTNSDERLVGLELELPLVEADFIAWAQAGAELGFVVQAGSSSEPGLLGYAARELRRFEQIANTGVGQVYAPNLVVEFADDTRFLLAPYADTSTFHKVATPPATPTDGLMLRTVVRNYPALVFDFGDLPRNAFINRALLRVASDSTTSVGNFEAIVVSELDSTLFGDPYAEIDLPDLTGAAYRITGRTSLDPRGVTEIAFDVTTAVQRIVNSVYAGRRGLVLTAGEDAFPNYDLTGTDPDFFFTQFNFYGTAAADTLRPRLEISYSRIADLEGGGE